MTRGDLRATPPTATIPSIATPSARKRSTMAREPKAVASTKARNRRGASVARVRPATAPLRVWSASGVRRPFSQSSAIRPDSSGFTCAAASDRAGISRSAIAAAIRSASTPDNPGTPGSRVRTGHSKRSFSQAYTSPKALWPASNPTMPGTMEPSTWPQMPRTGSGGMRSAGATIMSQVEVPTTFTIQPSRAPPPRPPTCASMEPTQTGIPAGSPRVSAHQGLKEPALWSLV